MRSTIKTGPRTVRLAKAHRVKAWKKFRSDLSQIGQAIAGESALAGGLISKTTAAQELARRMLISDESDSGKAPSKRPTPPDTNLGPETA
jgi:hypothetical protein